MSTVTLTLIDNPNDPNVVNIKWDVTDDDGTGAAKALAQHLLEHLREIQDQNPVTDVEPKE